MGELATLAKARQELEDLYLGVPDESVNLTFQDLAELKQQNGIGEKKKSNMEPIEEVGMGRLPSLDFSKALHGSRPRQHVVEEANKHVFSTRSTHHHHVHVEEETHRDHSKIVNNSRRNMHMVGMRNNIDDSIAYDDMSRMSVTSNATYQERGGRRRPGIPHSNICTICSTYIYLFRHRCLVCGRVYCRHCVSVGMSEMTEGRKCVECLGRRFSQRYIHRAGSIGCCMGYPSLTKQQELKWAEKGPRRSRERGGYGRSGMMSRSRSPITPRTPTRAQVSNSPTNSFVMSSQFSPFSTATPHIPY